MRPARKTQGMALLLVLGTIVITTVMGLAFISAQSTNLGIAQNVNRHAMARAIAEAGMELAVTEVKTNSDWRTDFSHGAWVTDEALNGGTFTITGEDGEDADGDGTITQPTEGDGDLSDDNADLLTLTVVGKYEGVTHTVVSVVTSATTASTNLLLVVSDDTSLEAQDTAKKALFESWGYVVNVIDDQASQAEFDTAISENAVVYVSERISSSNVNTKLNNAPIGVVNDETHLNDDLELSSAASTSTSASTIDIVDNTHYITSPFSTGSFTLFSSTSLVTYNSGTLATDATTLADQSGGSTTPTMWAVDAGGVLQDGTLAAGRRVAMPWGGTGVDINLLTTDGQTMLQRALQWAAMPITPLNPIARWKLDETSGTTAADDIGTNDGTYYNTPTLGEAGPDGTVMRVNGSTHYMEAAHISAYLLDNGTVSVWFKPDSVSGHNAIFSKDSSGYDTGGHLHIYSDGAALTVRFQSTSTSYTLTSGSVLQIGEWYHVVFRFGTGGCALYLNGDLVDTDSYTGGMGTTSGGSGNYEPLVIGAGTWTSGDLTSATINNHFDGSVDDARIYNYGLSGAEVQTIYDAGVAALGGAGSTPTLVALYRFNESLTAPNLIGQWKLDDTPANSATNVMFVVSNSGSLTSYDQSKKTLFESLGYTVNVVDDGDTQTDYDNAVAANDVVYISEQCTASSIGTKLTSARIGVVNEELELTDELGIASSRSFLFEDEVDITNTSHYITSTLSIGRISVTGSNQSIGGPTGTLAGGLTELAEWEDSTVDAISVLDAGGTLYGGGSAVARRVEMPWGGANFDVTDLTADGQTILQRSLQWAAASRATNEATANHGIHTNNPTLGATGQFDQAVDFDGTDDYIEIQHDSSYELRKGSVSLWFKADSTSGIKCMFSKDANGYTNGGHMRIYLESGVVKMRLQSTGAEYYVQSGSVSTGTWYHVVGTWGPRGMELYLNGTLVDTDTYTGGLDTTSGGSGNAEPIVIGADAIASGSGSATPLTNYFDGAIDDVRIYDAQLDAGQVTNVQAGSAPGLPAEGDVVEDTAGYGSAMNLNIPDITDTAWISGGGLDVASATTIQSSATADNLYNALTATDKMTFEIKFTPANLTQNGPARIASYSLNTGARNFTFGQTGQKYNFRLRTSATGTNGTPDVESTDVLDTSTVQHVIVTFDGTDVKMYRNGSEEVSTARSGDFSTWGTTYDFLLANEETDDRAWLGKIYRIAVYDDAMNNNQITNMFNGQTPGDGTTSGTTFSARWVEQP